MGRCVEVAEPLTLATRVASSSGSSEPTESSAKLAAATDDAAAAGGSQSPSSSSSQSSGLVAGGVGVERPVIKDSCLGVAAASWSLTISYSEPGGHASILLPRPADEADSGSGVRISMVSSSSNGNGEAHSGSWRYTTSMHEDCRMAGAPSLASSPNRRASKTLAPPAHGDLYEAVKTTLPASMRGAGSAAIT